MAIVQQDAVVQLPLDPPAYSYDQPDEDVDGQPSRTPEYPPPPSYAVIDPPPSYPGPPVQSATLRSLQASAGNILVLFHISRQREVRVPRPDWRHRRQPTNDVYLNQKCLASCAVLFGCIVFGLVALVLLEHARSLLGTNPVKSRLFARASVAVAVGGIAITLFSLSVVAIVVGFR